MNRIPQFLMLPNDLILRKVKSVGAGALEAPALVHSAAEGILPAPTSFLELQHRWQDASAPSARRRSELLQFPTRSPTTRKAP